MATLILKTSAETLPRVLTCAKHALKGIPSRLSCNDIILISKKRSSLSHREKPIQYRMKFVRAYRDTVGESERIWGKPWPYILECSHVMGLVKPFDIYDLQLTKKDYGRGGTMAYLDPRDEAFLLNNGYLDGIEE